MNYTKYKDNTEKRLSNEGKNSFERLFSMNPDQNLITPSSFFLALLVARTFNTVFCRSILGYGYLTRPFGLRLRFNHSV